MSTFIVLPSSNTPWNNESIASKVKHPVHHNTIEEAEKYAYDLAKLYNCNMVVVQIKSEVSCKMDIKIY